MNNMISFRPTTDSHNFKTIDVMACSDALSPVLQLESSSSQSTPQPRVLIFSQTPMLLKKNSEKLVFGDRLYQSFQIKPAQQSESLIVQESMPWQLHEVAQKQQDQKEVKFFCRQLLELKKTVDKLLGNIQAKNPEIEMPKQQKSLQAKSTESQPMKSYSPILDKSIQRFDSPLKKSSTPQQQLQGLTISPIPHRETFCQSNVSETSTKNLMQRKRKLVLYSG